MATPTAAELIAMHDTLDNLDTLKSITIAMIVVMTITFAIRMYTRLKIVHHFAAEDWLMVFAFLTVMESVCALLGIEKMLRDAIHGDRSKLDILGHIVSAGTTIWTVCDVLTRLSFGFFFLTVFAGKGNKNYRIYIRTVSIPLIFIAIPLIIIMVKETYGQPITTMNHHLYQNTAFFILQNIFMIIVVFSDFTVTALSIYYLYTIRLPMSSKLAAGVLLAIQCFAGVASLMRGIVAFQIREDIAPSTAHDFRLFYWAFLESGLGISTANLALTRPFFIYFYRKLTNKSSHLDIIPRKSGNEVLEMESSTGRRSSFEITKTQVVTVLEDTEGSDYGGLAKTGLIGDSFIVEVSRD